MMKKFLLSVTIFTILQIISSFLNMIVFSFLIITFPVLNNYTMPMFRSLLIFFYIFPLMIVLLVDYIRYRKLSFSLLDYIKHRKSLKHENNNEAVIEFKKILKIKVITFLAGLFIAWGLLIIFCGSVFHL